MLINSPSNGVYGTHACPLLRDPVIITINQFYSIKIKLPFFIPMLFVIITCNVVAVTGLDDKGGP